MLGMKENVTCLSYNCMPLQKSLTQAHAQAAEAESKLANLLQQHSSPSMQPASAQLVPAMDHLDSTQPYQELLRTIEDSIQLQFAKQATAAQPCCQDAVNQQAAVKLSTQLATAQPLFQAVQEAVHLQLAGRLPRQLSQQLQPAIKETRNIVDGSAALLLTEMRMNFASRGQLDAVVQQLHILQRDSEQASSFHAEQKQLTEHLLSSLASLTVMCLASQTEISID